MQLLPLNSALKLKSQMDHRPDDNCSFPLKITYRKDAWPGFDLQAVVWQSLASMMEGLC